jgi:hypothetical protein
VVAELESQAIAEADISIWLALELDGWRQAGKPSPHLEAAVFAYIDAGDDPLASLLAEKYFALHRRLATEPLLGHDGASALLSHARLIVLLASDESLSAAQIAKLIAARDTRTPIVWRQIDAVLGMLGCEPSLQLADVEQLYAVDRGLELEVFADADEAVCVEMVAEAGRRLGFPGDIDGALRALFPEDHSPKGPYLQILHFQCVLAEFYDHDLSAIYEFNPRGEASEWLFAQYPDSLEVAGNPFLNNAKSVDKLGPEWARSKDAGRRAEAYALVQLVEGLDSMGFAAKRELASWVRRLLVRRIRLAEGATVELPEAFSPAQAMRLIDAVSAEETRTRGILEQRLLDAACSLRHPAPTWIPRGLMDSVNATNVSRKKCGDCDFQNSADQRVVAYEAHAGRLTDLYIRAHLRTLSRVLEDRKQEWAENVGPGLAWGLKVVFVAHELDLAELPMAESIDDVPIEIQAMTFSDLLGGLDWHDEEVQRVFTDYVLEPLSRPRTPDVVRRSLLDLISDN